MPPGAAEHVGIRPAKSPDLPRARWLAVHDGSNLLGNPFPGQGCCKLLVDTQRAMPSPVTEALSTADNPPSIRNSNEEDGVDHKRLDSPTITPPSERVVARSHVVVGARLGKVILRGVERAGYSPTKLIQHLGAKKGSY